MTRFASALFAASALLLAAAAPAAAEVVRLEITSKTPYGTFRPGEYVLWRGKVHGELAPSEAIPDLDKAKRNEAGKVEYTTEIMLLMPADPSKGNGALLVDIPNRGRVYGIALYNGPRDEPFNSGNIRQGTGFLEDRRLQPGRGPVGAGQGRRAAELRRPRRQAALCRGCGLRHRARHRRLLCAERRRCRGHAQSAQRRDRARGRHRQVAERPVPQDPAAGWLQQGERPSRDGRHAHLRLGRRPAADPGLVARPESSADKAPSFADPEFRGVHEGPFTIGEIIAAVEKRGEIPPKILMLSSTTDFLSLRASLGRTGGAGTEEQAIPANVRMYDIAGASHAVQRRSSECTLPLAHLDWMPVSRATLVALDRWVAENVRPPDSKLMPLEPTTDADVLAAPKFLPKAVIERPKRDADGNALGGVRLPDMEAPLGVHAAQQEPKSFSCSLLGAFLPFSEARIAELYKNHDDYVNRIRVAARALEAERLLLPDDAAVIIADAAAMRWPPAERKKK